RRLDDQCRFTSWGSRGNSDYWIIAFGTCKFPSTARGTLVGAVVPVPLLRQRLYMHRSVQANTHHLCNAARIIAVALVDLCRQRRLHMPGLNTGKPASANAPYSHCDKGPASRPMRSMASASSVRTARISAGLVATLTSRTTFPALSTMHTLVSFTDTSNPT